MPSKLRELLCKLRWTEQLGEVTIRYVDRCTTHSENVLAGAEITELGRGWLAAGAKIIPYHRVLEVRRGNETLWKRTRTHARG
jgi:uncharacterized protein (UPF0248 family)